MMEYKGYMATVEFDAEAMLLHGQVINTRDVITFQGTSVEEVQQAFIDSIEDYLEFCAARQEEPERPFSGKLLLRMSPELHRSITICAAEQKTSVNKWLVAQLEEAVAHGSPHSARGVEHFSLLSYSALLPGTASRALAPTSSLAPLYVVNSKSGEFGPMSTSQTSELLLQRGNAVSFVAEGSQNVS